MGWDCRDRLRGVSRKWRFRLGPQCRDAPWGVSGAERTIPSATARPRGVWESTGEVAASETPHAG
jgi:hypothetical protein